MTGTSLFLASRTLSIPEEKYIEEKPPTIKIPPNFPSNFDFEYIRTTVEKLTDEMKVEQVKVINITKNILDPDSKYNLQYYQAIKSVGDNQLQERVKWLKLLASYNKKNSQTLEENIREKLNKINSERTQESESNNK